MTPIQTPDFDFDTWAELARSDPEAFESRRKALIDQLIGAAPAHLRDRLRCLQWRIDVERRRYKHPLKSCMVLYAMMWESVYGKGGLLEALNRLGEPLYTGSPPPAPPSGQVLPFRR
ncbi:MAG: DUF3135 domain-containing protein [Thiobacillaceae bacterium]